MISEEDENGDCGRRCADTFAKPVTALSNDEEGRRGGIRFDAMDVEDMAGRPVIHPITQSMN